MIREFSTVKSERIGQTKKSIIFSVKKNYFVDRNFIISDN